MSNNSNALHTHTVDYIGWYSIVLPCALCPKKEEKSIPQRAADTQKLVQDPQEECSISHLPPEQPAYRTLSENEYFFG